MKPTGEAEFSIFYGENATNLNLNLNNKELLKYAALTGEVKNVAVIQPHQTLIAQHDVNLTLDCGSLLAGVYQNHTVSWSIQYLTSGGGGMLEIYIAL